MKNYTKEERAEARKKLTKPVNDFLSSDALIVIYRGIFNKHKLNFRQGGLVSESVNVTLMGLEPESAIETNLHQILPELSADTTRELVVDINDRVFKEMRRRVQENITTPDRVWNKEELGEKPSENEEPIPTDEELDALVAKEEKEGWRAPEEEEITEVDSTETEDNKPNKVEVVNATIPTISIVEEKMGTTVQTKPGQVSAQAPILEKQGAVTPAVQEAPKPAYKGRIDPYREPVE